MLLPLCRAGDCSLREAVILSSALSRASIPVAHSGAALLRLAEMPYAGTTSFFIRVLLDKKYALPYRVVRPFMSNVYLSCSKGTIGRCPCNLSFGLPCNESLNRGSEALSAIDEMKAQHLQSLYALGSDAFCALGGSG